MANATDADKERLLSAASSPDLERDLGDAQLYKARQRPVGRLVPILVTTMFLGLAAMFALIIWAPSVFGVPAGQKDGLNPYADGRTLSANGDKFKIVLFSDLHYGERGTNNSWVKWADEAVSTPTPCASAALGRGLADNRMPRAPK